MVKRYLHSKVSCSTTHNTQHGNTLGCPLTDERIRNMVCIHIVLLFSHKQIKILSFVETWMDQKDKYHILSLICGSYN
jgi:hypothetical protein